MADQQLKDLTENTTPNDADILYLVVDPAGTPLDRKITWTTIKAFLKTYFDTLYPSGSGSSTGTNTGDQDATDFDIKDLTDSTNLRTTWSGKQDALGFTPEDVANKVTSFQSTPDDTHYPSEKLVKDSLDAKANANNVLALDNTVAFTPDADYEPATKKYVDDNAGGSPPIVRVYDLSSSRSGDNTTRINLTRPSGIISRYAWNGGGTNPQINATNFVVGKGVTLSGFSSANNGHFVITASGNDYFDIENANGSAESNVYNSYIYRDDTWTKPVNLKYIVVEVQGGGGSGVSGSSKLNGSSGGSGGYAKKLVPAESLGSTETVVVGGVNRTSSFGSIISCTGGGNGTSSTTGGSAGSASGGDINISGVTGSAGLDNSGTSSEDRFRAPDGANSFLGIGGKANVNGLVGVGGNASGYGAGGAGGAKSNAGGLGSQGIVIITEYY